MNILDMIQAASDPVKMRQQAAIYDQRAKQAERDLDWKDARKWMGEAIALRRRARSIEFGDA